MELRHLKHFICVAEELHFGRAATRLHIEQSPLSRSIKDLENDLGVVLFERTTRSTKLTNSGEIFLHEARQIINAVEKARLIVSRKNRDHDTSIRIGITDNFAQSYAVELFAQCRKEAPTLQLLVSEIPESELAIALKIGNIDAGISPEKTDKNGYISYPLWTDSIAILIPIKHHLAKKKHIKIEDILKNQLILLKPISYKAISELLENSDYATGETITFEQVSNLEMMILLVTSELGIGIATQSQLSTLNHPDICIQPAQPNTPIITSYLVTLNHHLDQIKIVLKCAQLLEKA
ncbi:HTH-type transcriptional regulator GltC [compost metagenome]